jgi:hypothetical protein
LQRLKDTQLAKARLIAIGRSESAYSTIVSTSITSSCGLNPLAR